MVEAKIILDGIKSLNEGTEDPLSDPGTLVRAVKLGILDAPHLKGQPGGKRKIKTRMVQSALFAYDETNSG